MNKEKKAKELSKTHLNQSITGQKSKKKKKKKKKMCIDNPIIEHSCLTNQKINELESLLKCVLPQINKRVSIPYREIRNVPVSKRKEFRTKYTLKQTLNETDNEVLNHLSFGANQVTRLIEQNQLSAIILTSINNEIVPMVEHIKTMCVINELPLVNMNNLQNITKANLQIKQCLAFGIKKSLQNSTNDLLKPLKKLQEYIEVNTLTKRKLINNQLSSNISNTIDTYKEPLVEILTIPKSTIACRAFDVPVNDDHNLGFIEEKIQPKFQLPFQLYKNPPSFPKSLLAPPKFKEVTSVRKYNKT